MILATNWTTAWLMTGMGIGVVFAILVLLVLILQVFNVVFADLEKKPAPAKSISKDDGEPHPHTVEYNADMAAVATTLYLYMNNAHDEESGVLTIHLDEHTAWHAQLNAGL